MNKIFGKGHDVSRRISAVLILILMMAGVLRFYHLNNQSLWNDELSSWARSHYSNLSAVMKNGVMTDANPPGYHMVVYFIEKYAGDDESALRFPSAMSGVLSVLVIFLLGVRLYSYKEGLIASAMLSVLWCPIYFSQEGRAYSMLLLFTLLATYFWVTMLMRLNEEKKISIYLRSGYVLTAILASYLHYFGLFLIAFQGLWGVLFLLRRRSALFNFLATYIFIFIAYLPWLQLMAQQLHGDNIRENIGWIKQPGNIIITFRHFLEFIFNDSLKFVLLALGMYVFLFIHALYNSIRFSGQKKIEVKGFPAGLFLFSWLTIPFVIIYFKSIVSFPILVNRNLIILLPAAYLLLSRAMTQLFTRPRHQVIITAMMVVFSIHWLILGGYYSIPSKEQWREAVYFMAENDKNYKNALIIGYAWNPQYFNYYLEKEGSVRRVTLMAGEEKDIPEIANIINKTSPPYVWYIYGQRIPDKSYINFMKKRFSLIEEKEFLGTGVLLFKNIGPVKKGVVRSDL